MDNRYPESECPLTYSGLNSDPFRVLLCQKKNIQRAFEAGALQSSKFVTFLMLK